LIKAFVLTSLLVTFSVSLDNFDKEKLNEFKNKYPKKSFTRLKAWNKMITKAKTSKTSKKIKYVNDFFNYIKYSTDIRHWRKKDYWATPVEFMGTGAGDCEDYAIAKYFALIKVGVPAKKLKIAYVKLLGKKTKFEEAHMVLLYIYSPGKNPIVLDNVNKKLQFAKNRKDLKLIYSFNAEGLWRAKNKGKLIKSGANKLSKWKQLIEKM
jgi:predicted transglutaminase-like cysteine proteinase